MELRSEYHDNYALYGNTSTSKNNGIMHIPTQNPKCRMKIQQPKCHILLVALEVAFIPKQHSLSEQALKQDLVSLLLSMQCNTYTECAQPLNEESFSASREGIPSKVPFPTESSGNFTAVPCTVFWWALLGTDNFSFL